MTQERSTDKDKPSFFLRMEECPKCHIKGREKVFAIFSDGHGYCFWCEYLKPINTYDHLKDIPSFTKDPVKMNTDPPFKGIPMGAKLPLGLEAIEWLKKYGINEAEVKGHGLLWEPDLKWLVFPYHKYSTDPDKPFKTLIGYQARRFDPTGGEHAQKWLTFGPRGDWDYFIGLPNLKRNGTIIVVEDIISAIKVGRDFTALPIFGSHMSIRQITACAERKAHLGIWLDRDKAMEAFKVASRASQYVSKAITIVSERDPKDHTDEEITRKILDAFPDLHATPF